MRQTTHRAGTRISQRIAQKRLHRGAHYTKPCADHTAQNHTGKPNLPHDAVLKRRPIDGDGLRCDVRKRDAPDNTRRNGHGADHDAKRQRRQKSSGERRDQHLEAHVLPEFLRIQRLGEFADGPDRSDPGCRIAEINGDEALRLDRIDAGVRLVPEDHFLLFRGRCPYRVD